MTFAAGGGARRLFARTDYLRRPILLPLLHLIDHQWCLWRSEVSLVRLIEQKLAIGRSESTVAGLVHRLCSLRLLLRLSMDIPPKQHVRKPLLA